MKKFCYKVKDIHPYSCHYDDRNEIIGRRVLALDRTFRTVGIGENRHLPAGWNDGGITIEGTYVGWIYGVKLERC